MSISIDRRAWPLVPVLYLLAIPTVALPASPDRITGSINTSRAFLLQGNVPQQTRALVDRGALDPTAKISGMKLMLAPTVAQTVDLAELIEQQQDPASPDYHRWLTPEEFGDRFGSSAGDLDKLTAWLTSQGFIVRQVARARNWISFDGSAATVEGAFHTALHRYAGADSHFGNATEPSVPEALAGIVAGIRGLNDFHPKPQHVRKMVPQFNNWNGAHYLAPDDMAAIYDISKLYAAGIDGTGQKLVIVGQTDFYMTDVEAFRSYFSLSANNPTVVLVGSDPGVNGDEPEALLDVEWSGAIARNAKIIFVNSTDVIDSALYQIDQVLAPVMSMSYGYCEVGSGTGIQLWAQQANAEGITWMSSSGDSGSASCDSDGETTASNGLAVLAPADIPEITAVGGTEFNEGSTGWNTQNGPTQASAAGYLPEMAWNDSSYGYGLAATGGGVSTIYPKPWWQTGPGVPNDGARDLPDVALTASADHDAYMFYEADWGGMCGIGGTSASSPSFAGMVALINHYLLSQGTLSKPGLGNINPTLYSLAQHSSGVFHDVTVGSNIEPCVHGTTGCTTGSYGYSAGPGYDMATGLGSVDAYNLATNWTSATPLSATAMTLTASANTLVSGASTNLTATVTAVSGAAVPNGKVTFLVGGNSLGSSVVSASTGIATLAVPASSLSAGANAIYATFVAPGIFSSSSSNVTVSVGIATTSSIVAAPQTISQNSTTQITVTIQPSSGSSVVTGSVAFSVGGAALGTSAVTQSGNTLAGVATRSIPGSSLVGGSNSITAAFAGTGGFLNSSTSIIVTVTGAAVSTTTAVTASPATLPANGTTQLTATITPASGTVAPTGAVTFKIGSATLGAGTMTTSGAKTLAAFTLSGSSLVAGANTITAAFAGSGNFTSSTATATVTATAAAVATTTTLAVSSASIPANGVTSLTATVTPASGSAPPTGTATFKLGSTVLGSATLAASGAKATASFTLNGGNLVAGANSITATYAGAGVFLNSTSAATTVTVTAALPGTSITATAAPASIAAAASTVLTVSVKPVSGSVAPAGSLTFSLGGASLGTAPLSASGATASATFTVKGSSLAIGANSIAVAYPGSSTFGASATSVTVSIPVIATTTSATASPASMAKTGTTQIAATVTPATGAAGATGIVNFAIGGSSVGSATLGSPNSAGVAIATLALPGTNLAFNANTIVATYAGTPQFSGSTGSVTVTITGAPVSTTLAVTANPATIASSASTQLSVSLTPASGSIAPTGSISFTLGKTSLGSATLSAAGSKATAVLTVNGSSLAVGSNTITATYAGSAAFTSSTGSLTVTATAPTASKVVVTLARASSNQQGFPVSMSLQETAGVATTVTGWTIAGTNFSSVFAGSFGSNKLPAKGTLTAMSIIQWSPMPNPLVMVFSGVDGSGQQWSQTASIATK
jgi:hypothetical protein